MAATLPQKRTVNCRAKAFEVDSHTPGIRLVFKAYPEWMQVYGGRSMLSQEM